MRGCEVVDGGSVRCVERLKALRCFDCDTGNKSA